MNKAWNQSSVKLLDLAESKLLTCLSTQYKTEFVSLKNPEHKLWTISLSKENLKLKTPLVLVHGLGGGIGLWVLNLDSLAKHRNLYAMDVLGFGKSSRVPLSANPKVADIEWIDSLEEWRKSMKLGSFHLVGHSLGGHISAGYALRYPENVKHLVLVEPWGMTGKPADFDTRPRPLWAKGLTALIRQFDPLAALRVAGPWGAGLIRRFRPDLGKRFSSPQAAAEVVYDYIHQCNIRTPATGEQAFRTLSDGFWCRNPVLDRIGRLPSTVGVSVIYGAKSWMDFRTGVMIQEACRKGNGAKVECHVLPNAGHHVYADQSRLFNELLNEICLKND